MGYLVGSVVLNSLIVIIFRYYRQFGINNFAAIVVNYVVCFIIGVIVTKGEVLNVTQIPTNWIPVLLFLGSLFILTFNVVAATVQAFSVTVATLVQKMSVILVVIFALLAYNEPLNFLRILGLLAGLLAIFLMSGRPEQPHLLRKSWMVLALPIVVFIASGAVDSTFLYMNRLNLTPGREGAFAAYLFGTAGILGMLYLIYPLMKGKRYSKRDISAGIVLGIPNFFTVYCIQKMLLTGMDGSVIFPIHNIAILIFSAILSKLLFKEHFATIKYAGIVLAITSILMLALGN